MSGGCLEGVSRVSVVCRVSQRCLEGIYGMSEWYVRCQDVSEGQVRTSKVRIDKVNTGAYMVSGRCLKGVRRLSVEYSNDMQGVKMYLKAKSGLVKLG